MCWICVFRGKKGLFFGVDCFEGDGGDSFFEEIGCEVDDELFD